MYSALKRLVVGPPIASSEEHHTRLGRPTALTVFASDAISSTAYATEEILLVLVPVAGLAALDDRSLDAAGRARLASLAKWKAGQTAIKVANEAVQMHGGIGVTDELDVGLFLKRIRVAQATLGDADYHCERYGALELAHA